MTRLPPPDLVIDPAYEVPIKIIGYIEPENAGWTRQSKRGRRRREKKLTEPQHRVRPSHPRWIEPDDDAYADAEDSGN